MKKLSFFLLSIAVLGGLLYYLDGFRSPVDSASLPTNTMGRQDIVQRVTFAGFVTSERRLSLRAPFTGYVQKVFVKIGQRVKKGAPLVVVTEEISDQSAYPIRAPFDGLVTNVTVTKGLKVEGEDPQNIMIDLVDDSKMYITTRVPEIDYPQISLGQEGAVRPTAITDRTYRGHVVELSLSGSADPNGYNKKVEFPVKILLDKPDSDLKVGMTVLVDIITSQRLNVLAIPHEYLEIEEGRYFVVKDDNTRIEVQVGVQDERSVEIIDGLSEGDIVKQVDFLAKGKGGREAY